MILPTSAADCAHMLVIPALLAAITIYPLGYKCNYIRADISMIIYVFSAISCIYGLQHIRQIKALAPCACARRAAPAIPGQGHHSLLPRAISAALDTSRHGALVVRSILRDLPGLIRGPSLALRLVDGLLLRALAVLRVHEYLSRSRPSIIVGRLIGRLPLAAIMGRLRGSGLRRA